MTQTTLSVDDTRGIIAALHKKFTDISARKRATSVMRRKTGRLRCANSRRWWTLFWWSAPRTVRIDRLREIGNEAGIPCYLIADGSEVKQEWFNGAHTVGITAGVLAPEVLVEDLIDALRRLGPVDVAELTGRQETIEFRLPPELTDVRNARAETPKV